MVDNLVVVKHPIILDENDNCRRTITNMLTSPSEELQAEAAIHVRDLLRKHFEFALKAEFLPHLVSLLESDSLGARAAAAAAFAVMTTETQGREYVRRAGALRPLTLLLREGVDSVAAELASLALMNAAVSDVCKDAIQAAGAIPLLLELVRSCVHSKPTRNLDVSTSGKRGESLPGKPAANNAAGTLMNLILNAGSKDAIEEAGGPAVFRDVVASEDDNVLAHRCRFLLSWMEMNLGNSFLEEIDSEPSLHRLTTGKSFLKHMASRRTTGSLAVPRQTTSRPGTQGNDFNMGESDEFSPSNTETKTRHGVRVTLGGVDVECKTVRQTSSKPQSPIGSILVTDG